MPVDLTGRYRDGDARDYVLMQDDVQRSDRSAFIAFVRVMRERAYHKPTSSIIPNAPSNAYRIIAQTVDNREVLILP